MPLAENFPDLTQLYGVGPLSGYLGGQQIDRARQSQQLNQQAALQDMYRNEQMLPIDMAAKQAQTRNYDASTAHIGETTRAASLKNNMDEKTFDERYKAEISKLAREMSDDQLKQTYNSVQQLMLDPSTRAIGEHLSRGMKDIFAEREKLSQQHSNRMEEIAATGEQQRQNIAAKPLTGKPALTLEQRVMAAKKASERLQILRDAAVVARQQGNEDLADSYDARAEAMVPQANAELNNAPKPGAPNLPGMGIQTNPPVDLSKQPTKQLSPLDKQALDWANANPNDPRAAEIKKRLGVK